MSDAAAARAFEERILGLLDRTATARPDGVPGAPGGVRRIAVVLPIPYRGGSLRGYKSIAKMLKLGSMQAGDALDVVAAVPSGHYVLSQEFAELRELGVMLRPFEWRTLDAATGHRALAFLGDAPPAQGSLGDMMVPDDGINNLLDCDFWLFVSDRLPRPVAPLRPTGHVIYDYIQQVRPDIFPKGFDDGTFVLNAQRARFVLCTTPFTRDAAIQYAGVRRDRVSIVDMEIEIDLEQRAAGGRAPKTKRPWMLWPTNTSPHKNQLGALDALELYYGKHGGALDVLCTGLNTDWFDLGAAPRNEHQDPWIKSVRDRIENSRWLRRRVRMTGELSDPDYFAALAGAQFVFHPALVDNGTYAATEGAWFGVPTLSHDYPAMRWMDERFRLSLAFCDFRDPRAGACALAAMASEAQARRALLPGRDFLRQHGWRQHARSFWATVSRLLETTA